MRSISGCAQVKTAWNITNRMASRITRPATGCSSTASSRVVSVSGLVGMWTASSMMRSASRWAARNSLRLGGFQRLGLCGGGSCCGQVVEPRSSSSMPPRRTAAAVMTGTPSSADSRAVSISSPRRRAMSIMLSTSSSGRPTCLSSITKAQRQAQIGGVGDAEQQVRRLPRSSGGPSTTSRVTSSSGLRARRRIGAGQIDQADAAAGRRAAGRRLLRSTVTPG